jgi:3-hydroxyanthranilate 3,4-dioxygenase
MSKLLPPINFKAWIDEHRHLLKPPVGNQVVYEDSEFIIMAVGGPNGRKDYHYDESEEFFYQLEGSITVKVIDEGKPRDIRIREGEIFLMPAGVPHSPQRPANTVGLVFERKRDPGELDGFMWFCENCGNKLDEKFVAITNIVTQLPPIFKEFFSSAERSTCKKCGTRIQDGPPTLTS